MNSLTPDHSFPVVFPGKGEARLPAGLEPYGKFKAPADVCQIKAEDDLQAVRIWLADCSGSPFTFDNYRKEAERLLLWCASRRTPLSGLTRDDFVEYDLFLSNPQPSSIWVGRAVPRSNPAWKPFVKPLAVSSRKQSFDVLRSLFSYLHNMGYLIANPLAAKRMARHKSAARKSKVERYLDETTWAFLVDHIEKMPQKTPRERQHHERVRWLFTLLYLTSARLIEVARAKMADFYMQDGLWWWRVYGKGDTEESVPVSPELHAALIRYRQFHGFTASPKYDESTPLVLNITGREGLTRKAIYKIVKTVCQSAAMELVATDEARAAKLDAATTHWLRHTSATHRVNNGEDLRIVSKTLLRHANIETTMIYQHADDNLAHAELSKLSVRGKPSGEG